ncbi:MAG: transcription antitermination factor NusB [bacterium]
MPAVSPARAVAFDILMLVEDGGFASDLLAARCAPLDSRDAGLASELVLGSLRVQAQLDYLIEYFSGRSRFDAPVRTALRMGIYQLRYLERIPRHAAVSESVELVRRARKASAAGLVNAVLRKIHRDPVAWPDRAIELSHPAWMLQRWDSQYGPETATAIARANLVPPQTYVRLAPGSEPPARLEPTDVPGCYRLAEGRAEEGMRIQDIGSQSIVPLLDLAPGQRFLDLCAAPGNKTAQALESGVWAVACDVNLSRLRGLRALACDRVVLDGTQPLPFGNTFDRILLDAPCSGTGTLARNPEIKWRLRPEDLPALHSRQVALLGNALGLLAPGGKLVYSTCSLEHEENDGVLDALGLQPRRVLRRIPGRDPGDGFFAAVLTSE